MKTTITYNNQRKVRNEHAAVSTTLKRDERKTFYNNQNYLFFEQEEMVHTVTKN